MAPTNKKSYIGVDQIYYALVTTDTSSSYVAGTPAVFAPAMNIVRSPKSNSKVQYADNQPFDSMNSKGETELEVEITGLTPDIQASVLGDTYNTATGRYYEGGGSSPDVALGFRAKMRGGYYRYFWFLKGTFMSPDEETPTQTDTPDPKSIKLKFVAVRTIKQFAFDGGTTDSAKAVWGDTSDSTFSSTNWFSAVQTPTTGSVSAITCTPVPADGATSQSVSVAPTLTFNNPLRTGVTGVQLVSSAGAVVAATIAINAAQLIITITPSSNLAAATKYLITLSGVTDIYGQTLALTAYDFTTA